MSRIYIFITSIIIMMLVSAPTPAFAQDPNCPIQSLCVTNGIFDVFVKAANQQIGTYTIRAGDSHPVTLNTGQPQSVLYGGDTGSPSTSFNTIRSYTSNTDYFTGPNHTSGFTVVNLDAYSTGTVAIGTNEIQTTWELPGPPATPDRLQIIQKIKLHGTSFFDSNVTVNTLVTNLSATPVNLGVRYLWDFQIGDDDGPTFSVSPGGSLLTKETEFQLPAFASYVIQDNPPTFNVHGTVSGFQSPGSISPDIIQFANWSLAYDTAFEYTIDPNRDMRDSAVVYLFGSDVTRAHQAAGQQTLSFATSIFADTPPSDCSGTPDTFEPDDTPATGSTLSLLLDQRHTLCPQSDEDCAKVTTNGPTQPNLLVETFDLEPDDINPNGDTQLTVYDELQNRIGMNQFRGLGPFPGSPDILQSSRVVWHPATGGVFNIKVIPEMPLNEQEGSGYSLRLANSFTYIDPVDQASWGPTRVNVPLVWRSGNTIYITQYFTYEQAELDVLNNVNKPATLAWEFRRPEVNTDTGVEIDKTNVDYGDYWQNVNGVCIGEYWTNLPNHSHRFAEESNPPGGCQSPYPNNPLAPDNEEFELYVDKTSQLVAGKAYYITIKFYIHPQYLNNNYQFYISKAEYCELWGTHDFFCNILPEDDLDKLTANLIEGYLQPAP